MKPNTITKIFTIEKMNMQLKRLISVLFCSFLMTSCSIQKQSPIKIHPYQKANDSEHLPVVNVSFVFTINRPQAKALDTQIQMYKELNLLNRYFVDEHNHKIFKFKMNRYYSFQDFKKRQCDLANRLNQPRPLIEESIPHAVKSCFPHRKTKEVFFIIYDAYNTKLKYSDITSLGFRNHGQPFILIDWQRLNYQTQSAEVHEMGHAFGLGHVCAPHATKQTPTNIMASYDCGKGSGGLRNLGFNAQQLQTILKNYQQYP